MFLFAFFVFPFLGFNFVLFMLGFFFFFGLCLQQANCVPTLAIYHKVLFIIMAFAGVCLDNCSLFNYGKIICCLCVLYFNFMYVTFCTQFHVLHSISSKFSFSLINECNLQYCLKHTSHRCDTATTHWLLCITAPAHWLLCITAPTHWLLYITASAHWLFCTTATAHWLLCITTPARWLLCITAPAHWLLCTTCWLSCNHCSRPLVRL